MQAVVDHLKTLSLAVESSGGRVMRYAHNVGSVLAIPSQSVALLAAIMLRGPGRPSASRRRSSPRGCCRGA